jgi:cytoskeletal protein CcmA (bactofilin family)
LQTTLDGKALSSHTHLWAHLTDKPLTFAPSAHSHVIADVTNLQTTLDGKALATHTHAYLSETTPASLDVNIVTLTGLYRGSTGAWTNKPPAGNNANALLNINTHSGSYYSQLWFDTNGDNFYHRTTDGATPRAWNKVWHAGNLTPLSTDTINQSVGSGFAVKGNLFLGATPSTPGTLQIRNSTGKLAIEIGTSVKGGDAKIHLKSDGSADFDGTVEVQNLVIVDAASSLVNNLNAEYINGVKEYKLAKAKVHSDAVGSGVVSGLVVTSLTSGSNVQLEAGVAYTESGARVEVTTPISVSLTDASSSNHRYDVVYILGSKYENNADTLNNEGQILVYVGPVAATPVIPLGSLPQGAIPIAALYRLKAAVGGNTVVNVGDIDMTVKKLRPINLTSTGVRIDRKVDIVGDLTATKATLSGEVKISYSSAKLIVESSDGDSSDAKPSTLYLKEGDSEHGLKVEYMGSSNFGAISTVLSGVSTERIKMYRDTNLVEIKTDLTVTGKLKSANTAKTVTVATATTSTTWTHNYGNTSYAVNLTSNSFARHVRWTNKTANTITIEIDDVYNEDILVDCILIGY